MLAFASHLAVVVPSERCVQRLQTFLYGGGAIGFQIEMVPSVVDVESTLTKRLTAPTLGELRGPARRSELATAVESSSRLREVWATGAAHFRHASGDISDATGSMLPCAAREGFADPSTLARAQLEWVRDVGSDAVSVGYAATLCMAWLEGPWSMAKVREVLGCLEAGGYEASVFLAAGGVALGRVLAEAANLDAGDLDQREIVRLFEMVPTGATRTALLQRLLAQDRARGGASAVLVEVVRRIGAAELVRAVGARGGEGTDLAGWGIAHDTLTFAEAGREALAELWLSAPAAFIVEEGRRRRLFEALGPSGAPVLLNADQARRDALLTVATDSIDGQLALSVALRVSRGESFPDRSLHRLCLLLLQTSHGTETLIDLADDVRARDLVRIAAMDVIAASPQLSARVFSERRLHVLDSAGVRRRRAEILQALQASATAGRRE